MDVDEYLDDPSSKERYVRVLFDVIAPGYDAFTRVFSFGMDQRWKRELVGEATALAPKGACVLDLACGTCDLAIGLASSLAAAQTIGVDASRIMLEEARLRPAVVEQQVSLLAGDMTNLGIRTSTVDIVSIGYGLRNAAGLETSLTEIARVLRPGGLLVTLDFYRPGSAIWRGLFLWYMWQAGRLAGWLWHREPATYGYLAPSIRKYVTIAEFNHALSRAGFIVERCLRHLGGGVGVHVARLKEPATKTATKKGK